MQLQYSRCPERRGARRVWQRAAAGARQRRLQLGSQLLGCLLLTLLAACSVRRVDVDPGGGTGGGTTTAGPVTFSNNGPEGVYPPTWPGTLPGLQARVFRYGTSQLVGTPPTPGDLQNLVLATGAATPAYVFIDQAMGSSGGINLQGTDTTPINVFLSPDVTGPLSVVSDALETTVVDWSGAVHITSAGTYDFNIIMGDDGASVYLNGSGTPGSGTLVAQRNYQQALQSSTYSFSNPGDYPFELFWVNQTYTAGIGGGAAVYLDIEGPAPVTFFSTDTNAIVIPATLGFPTITLGNPQILNLPSIADATLYKVANSSVFPWLPADDGNQALTFFVDGKVSRSVSADLLHLATPGAASTTLAPGPAGSFDGDGIWLLNAIRKSDGSIVGLYHAENQTFTGGGTGIWSSSGIALSTDDGVSWTKLGQAVGVGAPSRGATGGREIGCMLWMESKSRWLGIGHGLGFISTDPNAAPGTWKGYAAGVYNQTEPDPTGANSEAVLPGLSANMAECKLSYSTYFKQYVLVWRANDDNTLRMSISPDGTAWNEPLSLLNSGNPNMIIEFGQLMGPTDTSLGQATWLIYEQRPATTPGRYRDMVVRELLFQQP